MIEFDISKFEIKNVYLKYITRAVGGTMRILDTANSTADDEKIISKPVPVHVIDAFKRSHMTKYIKPVLTAVCYYDGIIVAMQPHPLGNVGKESYETLFGTKFWKSSIEHNIEKIIEPAARTGKWFIDGAVIYRFTGEKPPTNLSKDGKFQAIEVDAYRMTDLAHSSIHTTTRTCIAYMAGNGQNVISPPVWRTLDTVGKRKLEHGHADDGDEAIIFRGIEEHTFDKIDRLLSVNLNFALHASKALIENFGYESIEPLRLDDLMVNLKTVNLPKLDQSIKNSHAIGLKFTHAMAWLIGLSARERTLESATAVRGMLRYLTSRGIVHKTALSKDSVFRSGKDMNSVPLTSIEQLKQEKAERQRELLELEGPNEMEFVIPA